MAAQAETDTLHGHLSGLAIKRLCERAWKIAGDIRYTCLVKISNGHLYNLR